MGEVFLLVMSVPKLFESKNGRIIEIFGVESPGFPSKFQNQLYSYSFVLTLLRLFQPL